MASRRLEPPSATAPSPTDVAVIGAGAAGLAASRRLAAAGRSVRLIEARDRVGGRLWSVDGPIELGAEFVHGRPEATLSLLGEAGSGVVDVEGEHWAVEDGRIERIDERVSELHQLLRRAASLRSDMSVAQFLARVVEEDPRFRTAAEWVYRLVEDFDAADPERASLQAIVSEWGGDATFESLLGRPRGGYGTLINHMLRVLDPARVDLQLHSMVRAVRWSAGAVELDVEQHGVPQRLRASVLVITLPLGVLQAEPEEPAAVRFVPPLEQKRAALASLAMGPALKLMLRFKDPFWERVEGGRWLSAGFFHTKGPSFRTFWTSLPDRTCWLTAWMAGPRAALLSVETDDVIVARAVESLQSLFHGQVNVASLLEETRFHNWERDPCARGAYSYVCVGGTGARQDLAEPIDRTLFFAGEATDATGEATTVAGAIISGERAADEVLAAWD